jgi:hypothetical protein
VTSLHSYGGGSRSRASSVSERDLNGGAGRVETKRHLHTSGLFAHTPAHEINAWTRKCLVAHGPRTNAAGAHGSLASR